MTVIDFSSWIGRSSTITGHVDPDHVKKIALTLNAPVPFAGEPLPCLWQWGIFADSVPTSELGADGHPIPGDFLPPTNGLARMWAGGRVNFIKPLIVGVEGSKKSTILAVIEKEGRAGKLLFVTVRHEYFQNTVLAISEEQDIVYRQPAPPKLTGSESPPEPHWKSPIIPTSALLFRYSAVTFNTHRIHYDYPYVTKEEGYPGLVVHGPMIATYMLWGFQQANAQKRVLRFSYRGLRPLVAPKLFHVAGCIINTGAARVWAEQDGTLAHQADIEYE